MGFTDWLLNVLTGDEDEELLGPKPSIKYSWENYKYLHVLS
jgi:hypothetical protein